jgi:hypothetical protein
MAKTTFQAFGFCILRCTIQIIKVAQIMFSTNTYEIQNELINICPKKLLSSIHKTNSFSLVQNCMSNVQNTNFYKCLDKTDSCNSDSLYLKTESFASYITTIPLVKLATVTDSQITGIVIIFQSDNKFWFCKPDHLYIFFVQCG